ncbi:alpha beta hydrolase fold protein [Moniliophthora roreri]|nr:alpha beta hydrolase fold protein [Moniliophthora roreri]
MYERTLGYCGSERRFIEQFITCASGDTLYPHKTMPHHSGPMSKNPKEEDRRWRGSSELL